MKFPVELYFKTLVLLLFLDMLWIGLFFKSRFSRMIQNVQGSPMKIRVSGAVVAYIALLALAVMFLPKVGSPIEAFALGFFTYAVYDGTNYATLSKWDAKLAIMDSLWGGVLFATLKYALF